MGFFSDVRQAVSNLAAVNAGPVVNPPRMQPAALAPMPLDQPVQVRLDGNGNGIARITPPGARMGGTIWNVSNVYISAATAITDAQCTLFFSRGIQSATPFDALGQTATGSSGDTFSNGFDARPGDWITAQWSGGDANVVATMTVKGSVTPQQLCGGGV